jgi:formate dehydrogenase subunit gamma
MRMRSFALKCCSRLLLLLALGLPALPPGSGLGVALAQEQSQAQRQQEQPYNNAPIWREVRSGEEQYTSIKGRETGVLMQPLGETWRELRNGWIVPIAGWFVFGFACALALLHWRRGAIKLHAKPTGRLIQRFTALERVAHWTVAISFCVLGISGLIMMVGKYVLLPVIGYTLFSWLAQVAKLLHNFIGPVFIAGVVLLIVLFARHALPRAGDLVWLIKNRGGVATGAHVPCHFLNGGQKMWFWGGVVAMSLIVGVTGLVMDFPNFDQLRSTMIVANVLHASVGGILMGLSLFHIYMGSIGQEGAYEGMRYGYVDEAWAKEHHELWYEDVKSGKVRAGSAKGRPEAPQVAPG